MAKGFRRVDRFQQFLLPPDMASWLPDGHLAWFVIEVVDELDMAAFEAEFRMGRAGRAAYDPRMLLALLIYAYACGQRSSRQIERLCGTDVAFRVICAQDTPDHTTIARFRARHERGIVALFEQVLRVCARAGLGRVGVIAIDGTKIAANAAASANRCAGWFREEAERVVAEAGRVDAEEDALFGEDRRGDEMPKPWSGRGGRRARIRAALADLDADAEAHREAQKRREERIRRAEQVYTEPGHTTQERARIGPCPKEVDRVAVAREFLSRQIAEAEARVADRRAREAEAAARGTTICGTRPVGVEDSRRVIRARERLARAIARQAEQEAGATAAGAGEPSPGEPQQPQTAGKGRRRTEPVRNVSDPDSRLMPTRSGWLQGYNAQLAVTDDQLVLAVDVTQNPADVGCYQPMVLAAQAALVAMSPPGQPPEEIGVVTADAGYLSEHNLTVAGPDRLIATGKRRQMDRNARQDQTDGPPPAHANPTEAMDHRLRTPEGIATYRRRGVTVEPVNGHLKDRIGLRRFCRRGLAAVTSELHLAAAVANLLKAYRAQPA